MSNIILFTEKSQCCACGACMNVCSKNAISMEKDEYGFIYPFIDKEKCISCGICKTICAYQSIQETNTPKKAYVAMSKDNNLLMKSASGGIFSTIAQEVLNRNGIIFGCSLEFEHNILIPKHIKIEDFNNLYKLQGSKYVQSSIEYTYREVKMALQENRLVLFSGTPCQVAGLKSFLKNKNYTNLLTIDIICHGVPSADFFQSYIKELENNIKGKIISFNFREKSVGWKLKGSISYSKNKRLKKKLIHVNLSSYYKLFLTSAIYRENCYTCKYANCNRPGDITIGDYWGIEKEHPEFLTINNGEMDKNKGISCIIVNTNKGIDLIDKLGININLKSSTYEKISNGNKQLKYPSELNPQRNKILELYKNYGYSAVDKYYFQKLGLKKYLYLIQEIIYEIYDKYSKK